MTTRTDPVVRPAGPVDLQGLLDVYSHGRRLAPTPVEADTWERMMATDGLTVYCAEVDGCIVGAATLLVMPNLTYQCAPTAFIEAVVVVPEHRRRGVATAMIERMIADARAEGCNKVQLLSHNRHAEDGAHDLYTGLGFEPEAKGFRLYLGPVPTQVLAARSRT